MTLDELIKQIGDIIYDEVPITSTCPYCDRIIDGWILSTDYVEYVALAKKLIALIGHELIDGVHTTMDTRRFGGDPDESQG